MEDGEGGEDGVGVEDRAAEALVAGEDLGSFGVLSQEKGGFGGGVGRRGPLPLRVVEE